MQNRSLCHRYLTAPVNSVILKYLSKKASQTSSTQVSDYQTIQLQFIVRSGVTAFWTKIWNRITEILADEKPRQRPMVTAHIFSSHCHFGCFREHICKIRSGIHAILKIWNTHWKDVEINGCLASWGILSYRTFKSMQWWTHSTLLTPSSIRKGEERPRVWPIRVARGSPSSEQRMTFIIF